MEAKRTKIRSVNAQPQLACQLNTVLLLALFLLDRPVAHTPIYLAHLVICMFDSPSHFSPFELLQSKGWQTLLYITTLLPSVAVVFRAFQFSWSTEIHIQCVLRPCAQDFLLKLLMVSLPVEFFRLFLQLYISLTSGASHLKIPIIFDSAWHGVWVWSP